jgi:superfamily II DNA or RNA helicase
MVTIQIGNSMARIVGNLPDEVNFEMNNTLMFRPAGAEHSKKFKENKWDGTIRLYRPHLGQTFQSGLLSIAEAVLNKHHIQYTKRDERVKPEANLPNLKFTPFSGYDEREYQQITINKAKTRTRGVLKVATGGGKTIIASELIGNIQTYPFMFYVTTTDLLNQAHDALSSTLNCKIGRIGGGKFEMEKINVCTVQTAVRAVNLENKKFKLSDYVYDEEDEWDKKSIDNTERLSHLKKLIFHTKGVFFDECHHVASKSCMDIMNASPYAYWRYGASATPYREDGAEIMIQAAFGMKIVDISASYLIKNKYLITPYIFVEEIKDECRLNSYSSIYSQCVVNNEHFNGNVASTANYLVGNNMSTLVLVKQINHGKILNDLIPGSILVTSNLSKLRREKAISDLRTKTIKCMIATSLADEGLDIPTLDAALMAGGGASSTRVHQRVGRTLRRDTKSPNPRDKSIIVLYKHDAKYLKKHANRAIRILKSEPEFKLIRSKNHACLHDEINSVMKFNDEKPNDVFNL